MPRDGAIIFADLIGKLDGPYKSGPSKAWLNAVGKPIMRIAAPALSPNKRGVAFTLR